jgi:hypothetical protein
MTRHRESAGNGWQRGPRMRSPRPEGDRLMHSDAPGEADRWGPDDDLSPEVAADMAARLAETVLEYPMMPLADLLAELSPLDGDLRWSRPT